MEEAASWKGIHVHLVLDYWLISILVFVIMCDFKIRPLSETYTPKIIFLTKNVESTSCQFSSFIAPFFYSEVSILFFKWEVYTPKIIFLTKNVEHFPGIYYGWYTLNNGTPISWASSIMSVYNGPTPYVATTKGFTLPSEMKFAEATVKHFIFARLNFRELRVGGNSQALNFR